MMANSREPTELEKLNFVALIALHGLLSSGRQADTHEQVRMAREIANEFVMQAEARKVAEVEHEFKGGWGFIPL